MPFSGYTTILYPDDVAVLQRAYSQLCRTRGIAPDSPTAQHLAAQLIELRKSGVIDEAELVKALDS